MESRLSVPVDLVQEPFPGDALFDVGGGGHRSSWLEGCAFEIDVVGGRLHCFSIKEWGFVSVDDDVVALSLDCHRRLVVCDNPTALHEFNELVNSLEFLGHGDPS